LFSYKANRWKKRGLTMNGIKHGLFWEGTGFPAHVTIFANDGTVTVMQAGIEMGQGLYTKVSVLQ
jgi:xanthine dehydrogenase molybdopterin-binding subunit B